VDRFRPDSLRIALGDKASEQFTTGDVVNESGAAAVALARPNPLPRPTWVSAEFLTEQKVAPFTDMPGWMPWDGEISGLQMGGLHLTNVDRAMQAGLDRRAP
jgi:hypothetical protein